MSAELLDEDHATMDDTIRDTLRELNEREETVGAETPAIGKENAQAEPQIKDRPRDETGKFAKADKSAAKQDGESVADAGRANQQAAAPAAAEPDQPLVTTTGQQIDLARAPASWKPGAKAVWATLPEQVRAEVYRREADFMHGNKGLKENADFGQSIRQTVEPYRLLIEAEGGTPERAIADTLRTAALFRVGSPQQKMQALMALDQQFNIGFAQALEHNIIQRLQANGGQQPAQQFQPQQTFQDPRVDQLMASMQAQERSRAQQEEQVSNSATERFIGAKDEKGQPLYPFVDNVLDDMTARVQHLRRANPSMQHEEVLKQAYEASVWANPETRAVLIGQQQAQQQSQTEQLRKTEAAKRASRANMPTRGALPAGTALGSMDDTIRDTLRQLTG